MYSENKYGTVINESVASGGSVTADVDVEGIDSIYFVGQTTSGADDMDLQVYMYAPVDGTLISTNVLSEELSKQEPWVSISLKGLTKVQVKATNNNAATKTLKVHYGGQ